MEEVPSAGPGSQRAKEEAVNAYEFVGSIFLDFHKFFLQLPKILRNYFKED